MKKIYAGETCEARKRNVLESALQFLESAPDLESVIVPELVTEATPHLVRLWIERHSSDKKAKDRKDRIKTVEMED